MKIVLSSRGSRGDVNPIIEIAAELQAAGHEAMICVPEMFGDYCRKLGLIPSLYPEDSRAVMQNMGSGTGSLKGAFAFFSKSVEDQFNFMLDAAADADMLVTTINEIAAPTIAEYHRIPHFRIGFSPILPGRHAPPFMPWQNMPVFINKLGWKGMNLFSQTVINKFVNKRRSGLGMSKVTNSNHYHTSHSHTLLAINPELAPPCGSWEGRYKYNYTGYCYGRINGGLDRDLLRFIESGDPPVYVGFGSVHLPQPRQFTEMVVEAARVTGCRVILGQGWTGLGHNELGEKIYCIGDSDHGSLFPRMAGAVHHGGSGTTHTAARAGIPQFILPQFYDQYYWGNSIYKNKLGPRPVIPKKVTGRHLANVFREFTDGIYRKKALEMAHRMVDEDGVREITRICTSRKKATG